MSPTPSGRLFRTAEGRDLVLVRTFRAPIEDVWASITEPERTARWFGAWSWVGEAGPGHNVRYTMPFEPDSEPAEMTILVCEPPRRLVVRGTGDYAWDLEAGLSESEGVTELRFTHHLDDTIDVSNVGPGWEYYLDNLVASREGSPPVDFNDYFPSQAEYYRGVEKEAAEPPAL